MKPVFVKNIPDELEPNTHYISEEFSVSAHLCPCGCGLQVFLRLGNQNNKDVTEWSLIKDGEFVSIEPSIEIRGNCRSHYFITRNEVKW